MRYTQLGNTGLEVSQLGLGCYPLLAYPQEQVNAIVQRCLDLGITYFDTATGYGDSQEKLGVCLEGRRDKIVIASKSGANTREKALADVDQSLRLLRTDYIDAYQLHGLNSWERYNAATAPGGALDGLKEAKAAGKIGHIGMTTHWSEYALAGLNTGEFETLLVFLNFVENDCLNEVVPRARKQGVAVNIMKPFAAGAIYDAAIALKYVLSQPITLTVPGMISVAEVEQNVAVAAGDLTFTPEEQERLEETRARLDKMHCRHCDKCLPCPQGLPVPDMLYVEGMTRRIGNRWLEEENRYDTFSAAAERCDECRLCESRCPYGVNVLDAMAYQMDYMRKRYAAQ